MRRGLSGSALLLGGQTVAEQSEGPFTGEISAAMLLDAGCRYVIIGHSERRTHFAETDARVAAKMAAAFRGGLLPVVCLGESLQARDAGQTLEVIEAQLAPLFPLLPQEETQRRQWVLAYEPVWAIGSGRHATPDQAQEVHRFIRDRVAQACGTAVASEIRILYGGSVKAANAATLFAQKDVDGGLIGGASLTASEFLAIVKAYPAEP